MPDDSRNMADLVGMTGNFADLSRRGFMTTTAAATAGFTLATGPVRAQAIMTDTNGLTAGDVMVPVAGGQMPAYRAKPANVANPPVILVAMEIFGLHEHIKDVCRRLAKAGALAVAPDYYFRAADLTKITDVQQIFPIVNAKADAELMSDLDATVRWAQSDGGNVSRLGITGFCRGGRTSWMYNAHNPNLKAAVPWYGPVVGNPNPAMPKNPIDLVADMKAPVLGLYGGADTGIPNDTVERMRDAMRAAGKKVEVMIYPDTPHAFNADYRPTYRKDKAEDGWQRMLVWFRENGVLGGGST